MNAAAADDDDYYYDDYDERECCEGGTTFDIKPFSNHMAQGYQKSRILIIT